MTLEEYSQKLGIPMALLGRRVGVLRRQTMWKYARGHMLPPDDVCERIKEETAGAVTVDDLLAVCDRYRKLRKVQPTHGSQVADSAPRETRAA